MSGIVFMMLGVVAIFGAESSAGRDREFAAPRRAWKTSWASPTQIKRAGWAFIALGYVLLVNSTFFGWSL